VKGSTVAQMINYCQIQLTLIAERELMLRKEIHDCKIQTEFLTQILLDLRAEQITKENKR